MKLVIISPLEIIEVKANTPFRISFLTIRDNITPNEPTVNAAKLLVFSLFDS